MSIYEKILINLFSPAEILVSWIWMRGWSLKEVIKSVTSHKTLLYFMLVFVWQHDRGRSKYVTWYYSSLCGLLIFFVGSLWGRFPARRGNNFIEMSKKDLQVLFGML